MSRQRRGASESETAKRGRPPRQSVAEVRSAVLNSALSRIGTDGTRIGLENLSYEEAIKDAGVLRSAAYRIWPHRGEFVNDVMSLAATQRLFDDLDIGPATRAAVAGALTCQPACLGDVESRRQVLYDVLRRSVPVWAQELAASPQWRLRTALAAAAAPGAQGLPGDSPDRLGESLQRSAVDYLDALAEYFGRLRGVLGLELRDSGLTDDLLAETAVSIIERRALTSVIEDAANTRDGDDLRSRLDRTVIGPDGRDDWTAEALAVLGVLDAYTDLVPQAQYRPPAPEDSAGLGWRDERRPGQAVAELPPGFPDSDVLAGHTAPVRALAVAVMPDGVVLASGSQDGSVRLWDPVSGEQLGPPLQGHDGWVLGLTFITLDGQTWLASAGHDGTVRLWDPASGAQHSVLQGHAGWVAALTYLDIAEQPVLASGGADGLIRLWDVRTGAPWGEPVPTGDRYIDALAAARVGDRDVIAVAGPYTGLRLVDPATGSWRVLETGPARVRSCDFGTTADGTVTVVATANGSVVRWDALTGRRLAPSWPTQARELTCVSAIRDANGAEVIAAGGDRGWMGVFSTSSRLARQPQGSVTSTVRAVALATLTDGRTVLASALGERVLLWDASVRPLMSLDSVPNRLSDPVRARAREAIARLPDAVESLRLFEDAAFSPVGGLTQARALARQKRPDVSTSSFDGMGMAPDAVVNSLLAGDDKENLESRERAVGYPRGTAP